MNKEQKIEEMAVIGCVRNPQAHIAEECAKCDFKNGQCNSYRHAEALYNAGYRKVSDVENEAKDLRRQLADIEAENEKRLKANEDFATKHCRMKCEIAKMRVKEFAINLKKVIHERDYVQGYAEIGLIDDIDELLKEYE